MDWAFIFVGRQNICYLGLGVISKYHLPDVNNIRFPNAIQNKINQLAGGPFVWLPAVFNISVGMTTQYTPQKMDSFNLQNFRNGSSMKAGGGIGSLIGGLFGGGNGFGKGGSQGGWT